MFAAFGRDLLGELNSGRGAVSVISTWLRDWAGETYHRPVGSGSRRPEPEITSSAVGLVCAMLAMVTERQDW